MDDFKEFQGKSLDEAIRGACVFYDQPREKLEIELVQDAKSGIFGLVGARKAIIRARRVPARPGVGSLFGRPPAAGERAAAARPDIRPDTRSGVPGAPDADRTRGGRFPSRALERETAQPRPGADPVRRERRDKPRPDYAERREKHEARLTEGSERSERAEAGFSRYGARPERAGFVAANRFSRPAASPEDGDDALWDSPRGSFAPAPPLSSLDQTALENSVNDVAGRLITGILGTAPIRVTILDHRVDVRVDCGGDSGLLIGREGQTLSALQYLASRLVSRMMGAPVRVQFDVGDYRERQDERLRELALTLAERVRLTGRPCSTRPMSSYHRRLVHMALQDAPDIITRSSGEGALKRIIIQRRRTDRWDRADGPEEAERFRRAENGYPDRWD